MFTFGLALMLKSLAVNWHHESEVVLIMNKGEKCVQIFKCDITRVTTVILLIELKSRYVSVSFIINRFCENHHYSVHFRRGGDGLPPLGVEGDLHESTFCTFL